MAKITIIRKKGEDLAAELGLEIKQWFERRGAEVFLLENIAHHAEQSSFEDFIHQVPSDSLAVVVLGGDGTLLTWK